MQHREKGPGCCNDEQEPSNTDTSSVCVLNLGSPRVATSFNNSSLNDEESNNSYIAQVPYPHTMLVRPSYWSSAPWRCADDWPTCCITCLCPCITFGQIAKIADGRSSCCVYSTIYLLLSLICVQCLYSFVNRTKFRAKYSLPEQPFSDFCMHCCCEICALSQERREIKYRAGWVQSETTPPLTQGMHRLEITLVLDVHLTLLAHQDSCTEFDDSIIVLFEICEEITWFNGIKVCLRYVTSFEFIAELC